MIILYEKEIYSVKHPINILAIQNFYLRSVCERIQITCKITLPYNYIDLQVYRGQIPQSLNKIFINFSTNKSLCETPIKKWV
jgi:hypothetical protein